MEWWDRCVDADARPLLMNARLPVWVGVDASVKRDGDGAALNDVTRFSAGAEDRTHRSDFDPWRAASSIYPRLGFDQPHRNQ